MRPKNVLQRNQFENNGSVLPHHLTHAFLKMPTVNNYTDASLLAALPEELCLAIIDELDMPSIFALSETSRFFNRLANPTADSRRPLLTEFLLEAQDLPRWKRTRFACFACNKILPRHRFIDSQVATILGKGASQEKTRHCVQCAVKEGHFALASVVTQYSRERVLCAQCKKLIGGVVCDTCRFCKTV